MAREAYVLDTSALLTLIEDEPGADRVEEVLRHHDCVIPWIALLEVHYVTLQAEGVDEAEHRHALLESLPAEIRWLADSRVMRAASRFKASHRMSLADAIVGGVASARSATLLHKDPEFETLDGQIVIESLPYKTTNR